MCPEARWSGLLPVLVSRRLRASTTASARSGACSTKATAPRGTPALRNRSTMNECSFGQSPEPLNATGVQRPGRGGGPRRQNRGSWCNGTCGCPPPPVDGLVVDLDRLSARIAAKPGFTSARPSTRFFRSMEPATPGTFRCRMSGRSADPARDVPGLSDRPSTGPASAGEGAGQRRGRHRALHEARRHPVRPGPVLRIGPGAATAASEPQTEAPR